MTMFENHPTNDSRAGDTALAEIDRPSATLSEAYREQGFHALDLMGITHLFHKCDKRLEFIGEGVTNEALETKAKEHLQEYHPALWQERREALSG